MRRSESDVFRELPEANRYNRTVRLPCPEHRRATCGIGPDTAPRGFARAEYPELENRRG
jgi:hypothetical protein